MENTNQISGTKRAKPGRTVDRLFKVAVIVIAAFIVGVTVLVVGRMAVYKIHAYERGLHLRGGRFIGEDQPGWHVQIPLVDTVIIVQVSERLGYVERIAAMTSDDVTMVVSLQYTYVVTNAPRYALEVTDPERIVFEFVQGKLRDVINTKSMTEVMHSRAEMSQEILDVIKTKEEQYGVRFATVQMQSASPPDEVVQAIKDRMVAVQRQEQAQAEAEQTKTKADAEFYAAQKRADAEFYAAQKQADAEAYQIAKTAEAQQDAIRVILAELDKRGDIGQKYIEYMIAQELKENSKWIISGEGTPIIDLREDAARSR
jgi:regulator of protease activity HflC (stomatin/prohibitin superfamily)